MHGRTRMLHRLVQPNLAACAQVAVPQPSSETALPSMHLMTIIARGSLAPKDPKRTVHVAVVQTRERLRLTSTEVKRPVTLTGLSGFREGSCCLCKSRWQRQSHSAAAEANLLAALALTVNRSQNQVRPGSTADLRPPAGTAATASGTSDQCTNCQQEPDTRIRACYCLLAKHPEVYLQIRIVNTT